MSDKSSQSVSSGEKYRNERGMSVIKDGMKQRKQAEQRQQAENSAASGRKPPWLRIQMPGGERFDAVKRNVNEHRLSTVCAESHCPNMGECWSNGTATIMLMGSVCTRACRFCAVDTGNPSGWLDHEEPENTAKSVELMGLRYIVLTSVDRDDLDDGGAAHYAACIRAIKTRTPEVVVEALTPDFDAREPDVEAVVDSGLEVFAQNVETVERLTSRVRDPRAGYRKTLDVLAHAKRHRPDVLTKTSLMLGLGETDDEILATFDDLQGNRRGYRDPRPVPAPHQESSGGGALGHAGGVRALSSAGSREGLHGGGCRPAGSLQLPGRPGVREEQPGARRARRHTGTGTRSRDHSRDQCRLGVHRGRAVGQAS